MNAPTNSLIKQSETIGEYLSSPKGQAKLSQYLPDKIKQQRFQTNVITIIANNPSLAECDKATIVSASLQSETLNLPLSNQLGFCYVVPYWDSKNNRMAGQFQIGWKGFVQLSHRTGQVKRLIAIEIKEGELVSWNPITEEATLNPIMEEDKRKKAPTIGYYARLETITGFIKEMYWTKEKMEAHANKYSKAFKGGKGFSLWTSDFDEMGKKTVLKQLLSKWSPMTNDNLDLARALQIDQSVIEEDGTITYVDNDGRNVEPIPVEVKPIKEADKVLIETKNGKVSLDSLKSIKKEDNPNDDNLPF